MNADSIPARLAIYTAAAITFVLAYRSSPSALIIG
jgi:hypothetical protein